MMKKNILCDIKLAGGIKPDLFFNVILDRYQLLINDAETKTYDEYLSEFQKKTVINSIFKNHKNIYYKNIFV
jgi:hypothetical protein